MTKKLIKYFFGIIGFTLIYSCAQVVSPSGGIKDKIPPEVLKAKPENKSLNFNSTVIELEFDEFIQLDNLKEQMIISPPLKYDLQTKISGKSLRIEIKDTLKENTTYVFNFGDAIVDITERNPIPSFQYVFSTGSTIDSLTIKGTIADAFTLKAEKDMFIMLYKSQGDSLPMLELPDYVAKSKKDGSFQISNVKEGSYKLFALKDANKNYLFDRPDEIIAFRKKALKVKKNINSVMLWSFKENREKQYIKEQTEDQSQLVLEFNKRIKNFKFEILDTVPSVRLKSYIGANRDSVIFWWEQMPGTKIEMAVSDDTLFRDTIKFKVDSLSKRLKLEKTLAGKQNYYAPIALSFNRPIAKLNAKKVKIYNRGDSSLVPFKLKRAKSKAQNLFHLNFNFKEDSAYRISILPKAFIDIYQETTDTIESIFSFNKASDFGTLKVTINTRYKGPKIIQLTDKNGKIIQEVFTNKTKQIEPVVAQFNHLKNGSYGIQFIKDYNNNKRWTTGNYLKGKYAEQVIIYDESINIRSNWDKEIEWIIK